MATSIAELVKWQEWRLVEVHMPQHHCPVDLATVSTAVGCGKSNPPASTAIQV